MFSSRFHSLESRFYRTNLIFIVLRWFSWSQNLDEATLFMNDFNRAYLTEYKHPNFKSTGRILRERCGARPESLNR